MFHFIPVNGAKQKLGGENLLENWTSLSSTLKLNAIITICLNYPVNAKHFNNALNHFVLYSNKYIVTCCTLH